MKVGEVKGKSRRYPQLRLPSRYAGLAGATASVSESWERGESVAFVIRVADQTGSSKGEERSELQGYAPPAPCGGPDADSNLALGLFFLIS